MGNKVKFGLSNVHYAKMNIANDGTISYDTPVAIPGAVKLSLDAEGEETPFYADNVKYFNSYANNGYSGELEIADIPESFRTDILGEIQDSNGALIEKADAKVSPFALMYQIDGDSKNRRCVYYNTTVSRPSTEANTIEGNKEVSTDKLSITTSARTSDNKVRAILEESETNTAVYNAFYDSVYEEATASV